MRKFIICIGTLMLFVVGCSKKAISPMEFSFRGESINYDIGNYVQPAIANYISEDLCVVFPEQNEMQDESITAVSSLSFDVTNDKVIYSENVYDKLYPASTTKLLTALMVLKYGNLEDVVTIREDNGGIVVPGAKLCNFKKGDLVTLETLLNCLLVYSGNDAAVAIAEHIDGSEEIFANRMNEEAKKIGAVSTHFLNASGLHDPNHYTTAYDMYLIFKECLNYDLFQTIISKNSYTAHYLSNGIAKTVDFETTNMFLLKTMEAPENMSVIGGKTGSTSKAGDCLILYSKDQTGLYYITGIFKADSRKELYQQMAYLLEKK